MTDKPTPPPGKRFITEDEENRWPVAIGTLGKSRMRLAELTDLFPMTVPHLKATESELAQAEAQLGFSLDGQHRTLLSYGNGWPEITVDSDFLSTADLGVGPLWERAKFGLDIFYQEAAGYIELPRRESIYPFCVSRYQADIYVIQRDSEISYGGHKVIWFANEIIQEWPNIYQWLLSISTYTNLRIRDIEKESQEGDGVLS